MLEICRASEHSPETTAAVSPKVRLYYTTMTEAAKSGAEPARQKVLSHYDTRPPTALVCRAARKFPSSRRPRSLFCVSWVLRLRFEVLGRPNVERVHASGRRCIFAFWHRGIFPATWWWRHRGIVVMNSTNFDGQWTRRVIEGVGFGTAQGSSTRGGLRGLARWRGKSNRGATRRLPSTGRAARVTLRSRDLSCWRAEPVRPSSVFTFTLNARTRLRKAGICFRFPIHFRAWRW